MNDKDIGTIQAVLNRLNSERLPRALELQAKVNDGERLAYTDMAFLQRVFDETNTFKTMVARHPEYEPLVTRLIALYSDITTKALENEKKQPNA